MQTSTAANTDRAEQLEALGFTGEADYAEHQALLQRASDAAVQTMRATIAAGGLPVVHLSETGLNAGRRFCPAPKDDSSRSVHAMYAPFENPVFLATVCEQCLEVWALEAYDDGEEIPDYLIEPRAAAKLAAAKALAHIEGEKGSQ